MRTQHRILLIGVMSMAMASALAQQSQQYPQPPAGKVVVPKESMDTVKLDLAIEKQKNIEAKAAALQQSIQPQMQDLQKGYTEEKLAIAQYLAAIRKANGWGDEVVIDQIPTSPNFGKLIKTEKPAAPPQPPANPPASKPSK